VAQLSALGGAKRSKDSVVLTSAALQGQGGAAEQLLHHMIKGLTVSAARDSITLHMQSPTAQRLVSWRD